MGISMGRSGAKRYLHSLLKWIRLVAEQPNDSTLRRGPLLAVACGASLSWAGPRWRVSNDPGAQPQAAPGRLFKLALPVRAPLVGCSVPVRWLPNWIRSSRSPCSVRAGGGIIK
jgi:hypothetical protein